MDDLISRDSHTIASLMGYLITTREPSLVVKVRNYYRYKNVLNYYRYKNVLTCSYPINTDNGFFDNDANHHEHQKKMTRQRTN